MNDKERKLSRRRFLEHSAMATAMTATCYTVALKTDALAEPPSNPAMFAMSGNDSSPYPYGEV